LDKVDRDRETLRKQLSVVSNTNTSMDYKGGVTISSQAFHYTEEMNLK